MNSKTTDNDGKCNFNNVFNGDYSLTVSKTDYISSTDTVTISGSDVDKKVNLIPITSTSTFTHNALISQFFMNTIIIDSGGGSIDYGDGSTETLSSGTHRFEHDYSDITQTYTVNIINLTDVLSVNKGIVSAYLPSLISLNDNCFMGCTSLTSISLPNMSSIGCFTFYGCTSLNSIDLSKVTSIGDRAFTDCTSLTSVDLSMLTTVNTSVFEGCTSLNSVRFSNSTPPNLGSYCFKSVPSSCTIYCPSGSKSSYKTRFNNQGYYFNIVEY